MKSLDSLSSKEQYQVYGECLACLAYFAIETKRCGRREAETALANATRLNETPTFQKRLNWWNSKLGNIQWAFHVNGLEGIEVHGASMPVKTSRGREGQVGTQSRIKAFAIPLFRDDLPQCQSLARKYLSPGASLPKAIHAAILDITPVGAVDELSSDDDPTAKPLASDDAQGTPADGDTPYSPSGIDEREKINRQLRARRGQKEFRDALRARYGDQCMITGCNLLSIVEAAHISPYLGPKDNAPDNGLLLRADIHTLYDLDLIAVDPITLCVCVHPELPAEYKTLANQLLRATDPHRPSQQALQERRRRFQERCRMPADK